MSVLPDDDHRAVGLHLAQQVDTPRRVRAVEHEVAGDRDEVGRRGVDRRRGPPRAPAALPWTSERIASAGHRSTPSPGMMKLMRRLAGDLAVDAGDAPAAAEPAAELLHRDLEAERVARDDDPLEAALVDAGEQPDPVAEARLLGDVDGHRLGERLDLEDAGHDRQPREVALEEPLGGGHGLEADDPLRLGVVLDDPVDEQERPAMRDQPLDLAGRVDRGGWRVGHGRLQVGRGQSGRCRSGRAARYVQVCIDVRAAARPGRPRSPRGRAGWS